MLHQFDFDVVGAVDKMMRMPFSNSTGPSKRKRQAFDIGQGCIEIIAGQRKVVQALIASQFHIGKVAVGYGDLNRSYTPEPRSPSPFKGGICGGLERTACTRQRFLRRFSSRGGRD